MTARDDLDRRLADWMTDVASASAPAAPFERIVTLTAKTRTRSRWLAAFGSNWPGAFPRRRIVWEWPIERRGLVSAAVVALLLAALIVGAVLVGAVLRRERPFPDSETNGWIAFDADHDAGPATLPDHDIYVVGHDFVARRIVGSDADHLDQICPAFSADATRLAFGQAHGDPQNGYSDAALGIADMDRDGNVAALDSIPIGGALPAPCPIWSPDGRRIALYFSDAWNGNFELPEEAGAVWILTLEDEHITKLPGMWAKRMSWAPDGSRLAIASGNHPQTLPEVGGPLLVYVVESGELASVPGATEVTAVSWSPDGSRLAYQRIRNPGTVINGAILPGTDGQEIWTIGADGTGRTLQTAEFSVRHGVGPVWSSDGNRIAYQFVCAGHPFRPGRCGEQHEVAVLTPSTVVSETNPVGTETVLPIARSDGAHGPALWFPDSVTWSPDGRKLLYAAWSESIESESNESFAGLVVVDVDGRLPPVVYQVPVQDGSWGRLPGS